MVESPVKLGTVFTVATLDLDFAFVLNGVSDEFLDDLRGGRGCYNILAKEDLCHLIDRITLIYAGVAFDLHRQLNHTAQIGRYDEVCAELLGEGDGISFGDTVLGLGDQLFDCLTEVCREDAVIVIQLVQIQTLQHADIHGHGGHDVLDEHVGFIAVVPCGNGKHIVLTVILTSCDGTGFVDGVLGLRMSHLLQGVTAEDVHGRIMASLGIDDES